MLQFRRSRKHFFPSVWQPHSLPRSSTKPASTFADIDSFTQANGTAIKEGQLVYLAGKYSSSIGPVFALIKNAVDGNVIRDADGCAPSFNQGYQVATDAETFDACYVTDNGDSPIYDKETLDGIIGPDVTYDDVKALIESK